MSITDLYHQHSCISVAGWFQQYEQELKKRDTVSFKSMYPYIFFKLAHDFAFSKANSMNIHDPLVIKYFMGDFCYKQVMKDFQRSAIVMHTQRERMYFGSPILSHKRMRNFSCHTGKSVDDFVTFITCLEQKVFEGRLSNFDERQKETLAMILQIINQGVSAVAIKMFNLWLQVRSGENVQLSSDDVNAVRYLIRQDKSYKKGSTQIDIVCDDDGKIQLHRREYIKVQKLDMESLIEPDAAKDERWCLVMFFCKDGTGEACDWRLHFSVSHIQARHLWPVSSDSPQCYSDISTSNGGSLMSIRNNSGGKPENQKFEDRRTRSSGRRPISDIQYRRKAKQSLKLRYNPLDWLKQFQEYSNVKHTRDFQELWSLSHDRCLETQDWEAINYFLGCFCYTQVRERFNLNTIILTTKTEKLYFGSSGPLDDNRSVHEDDSYIGDFVAFITCLEKKVFKRSFRQINNCQKRTLGVILRFLAQNSSAVVSKLFKLCVRTVSGSGDLEDATIQVEGLAQIGIESKGGNIYLTREQNLTLRKSNEEEKSPFGEDVTESWTMVTNIMKVRSMNYSNWSLHFSVVQNSQKDRLTRTSSGSSKSSLSFCYPGITPYNCSPSGSSLKTGAHGTNLKRRSSDWNVDEAKKSKLAILPGHKLETLSDELGNGIYYAAATDASSVLSRLSELKKNYFSSGNENWIAKDHLGI